MPQPLRRLPRAGALALGAALAWSPALLALGAGALPAGSPYLAPGAPSPLHASQRFVLEVDDLARGVALPLADAQRALVVVVPRAGGEAKGLALEDAAGRRLEPGARGSGVAAARRFDDAELSRFDLPAAGAVLELDLAPGTYTLRGEGAATVLVAEPESSLELRVRTRPLASRAGEPVTVEATFAPGAGGAAPRATRVLARFADAAGPRQLTLAETRPGVWAATFVPAADGLTRIDVRVDAEGTLADGRAFRRTGLAGTMATRAVADLDTARLAHVDGALQVPVRGAAGAYRVEATFGAALADGRVVGLAWAAQDLLLDREATIALPVPAEAAGADRVTVRLLNHDTLGLEREIELALGVAGDPRREAPRAELPASKRLGRRLAEGAGDEHPEDAGASAASGAADAP